MTSKSQICSLLGIDIDRKTIVSLLKKQGISVKADGGKLVCEIPLVREDIDAYPDLAEDIMRFYGYENIVSTHSENTHQTRGFIDTHDENVQKIREKLSSLGIDETLNYSFISPDACDKLLLAKDDACRNMIPVKNPLSRDISMMRTQLVSSMLATLSRNHARKNDSLRYYELDKVFIGKLPLETLPQERDTLCVGFMNAGDFYDIKYVVSQIAEVFGEYDFTPSAKSYLHPKQSLHIEGNGLHGDFGKLHPLVCENYDLPAEVYIMQLDMIDAMNTPHKFAKYTPISKLHPVDRDFAFVVKKEVPVGDMIRSLKTASEFIYDIKLFDIYEGEQIEQGYKSVALSVRLQPTDATFSDSVIKQIADGIIEKAEKEYGAKLR